MRLAEYFLYQLIHYRLLLLILQRIYYHRLPSHPKGPKTQWERPYDETERGEPVYTHTRTHKSGERYSAAAPSTHTSAHTTTKRQRDEKTATTTETGTGAGTDREDSAGACVCVLCVYPV